MPSKSPKRELKARGITSLVVAPDSKTYLLPWFSVETMKAGLVLATVRVAGSPEADTAHLVMEGEASEIHCKPDTGDAWDISIFTRRLVPVARTKVSFRSMVIHSLRPSAGMV